MIEIERKFLVNNNSFLDDFSRSNRIVQGYLSSHPERTVRVRIKGENGYLTIKGKSEGFSRYEWEKEIAIEEAEKLLQLCETGVIDKIRYDVIVGTHIYEVDVFYGENEGLVLAEIELQTEDETFEKPNWLGTEVTEDVKYYNSYLSKHPFKTW
ncbi:CYTH domain-containing protein [Flavobacterium haoranii]|uniref:CYTH domain-containing protein n=1 Tax=Flavobacterium haoranii TaxID=683124 RepID=A0A1M6E7B9_9FLAO|nr:CYTH domain-containing protein [Flavobacterium haoranii]SHI81386.1 CYTH domain-containing protein [Flavobacterium haoranii]